MTDHREIEQLVKAALREVGEALTSLRDCGDRPGMYDQGASALSAYTTIRQELGRLATIAKTAEERVRELEEERDQFFLHANAHRAGEQRAEAALATEREARERAEAERVRKLERAYELVHRRAVEAEARAEHAEEALRAARPYVEEGAVSMSIEFTEESNRRSAELLARIDAALAAEREARERAEAERDDLLARWNAAPSKRAAMDQAKAAEARAERAEEALRVIAEGESPRPHEDVAAEALSEIEKRLAQDEGEGAPDHECDASFDRTVCACGVMHHYCTTCGRQVDPCDEGEDA